MVKSNRIIKSYLGNYIIIFKRFVGKKNEKEKKGKKLIELIQITRIACIINECSNLCPLCRLSQLTFPKAKLLLMSSHQEDLNDWYQSLISAIRYIHATHKHM